MSGKYKIRIEKDFFPIFLIIISLFCAWLAGELLVDTNKNLNDVMALIYITIVTLIASILEPIIKLIGVKKHESKYSALLIAILIAVIIWGHDFINDNNQIMEYIVSFSKRGGFTAVSISILIIQLAEINYLSQIESEKEIHKERQDNRKKEIEYKERELEQKKKDINSEKARIEYEKRVKELDRENKELKKNINKRKEDEN